jgi:hypothetical protein
VHGKYLLKVFKHQGGLNVSSKFTQRDILIKCRAYLCNHRYQRSRCYSIVVDNF